MLEYARHTTLAAVEGLSTSQLDFCHSERGNSVATLLAHIAAVERAYAVRTMENRLPTAQEKDEWRAALTLGAQARACHHGRPLYTYLEELTSVRRQTLTGFSNVQDEWLNQEFELTDGSLVNHYWAWFHVLEDEINHRGQILLIRNHLLS